MDWFTSKTAMVIAVIVILSAVIGFFIYSNMDMEQESLQDVCDDLAENINDVSSTNGEVKERFTFSRDSSATELPATVNDQAYEIQITSRLVILRQEGKDTAMTDLLNPVHLFPPPSGTILGLDKVQRADLLVENLTIISGTDFYLENRMYSMPGPEYPTFCFTESEPMMIADVSELVTEINKISSYGVFDDLNDTEQIVLEHDCSFSKDVIVVNGRYAGFPTIDHTWKPEFNFETTDAHLNSSDGENQALHLKKGKIVSIQRRHMRLTDSLDDDGVPLEAVDIFIFMGGSR